MTTLGQNDAKQLTTVNPQVKDFAIAETEVIKWKGPDNFDIEGLLLKPLGYVAGQRYPLILQIHGGPYGKFGDSFSARNQIFAAHGYAVLMPNPARLEPATATNSQSPTSAIGAAKISKTSWPA
jgi:dipeptidyl aminopeptidase/acylaminoacyl peptidase